MMPGMDPKVVAVYRSVGKLLSTYRSGKIPKAFKACRVRNVANSRQLLSAKSTNAVISVLENASDFN
jgi:hypothetical protein